MSTLVFKTGRRANIDLTATSWGAESENLFDEGIVIFEDSRGGHTVGGRESSVNQRVDLKSNLPSPQNLAGERLITAASPAVALPRLHGTGQGFDNAIVVKPWQIARG